MTHQVLIVSNDQNIIDGLNEYFINKHYQIKQRVYSDNVIVDTIEDAADVCIYDMDRFSEKHLETLKVIKKIKPGLPIVVLSEDNTFNFLQKIAQMKVYYCAMKPIQWGEFESVVDSIERTRLLNRKNVSHGA